MEVQLRLDGQGRTTWEAPSADPETVERDMESPSESKHSTAPADQTSTDPAIDFSPKAIMTSSLAPPSSHTEIWQTWVDAILLDCEIADCGFMPRTFWMPADGTEPRCDLERMALDVFNHHVPKDYMFDPSSSGAEWWVQIRPSPPNMGRYAMHASSDEGDDGMSKNGISFHWDKDEDLRIMAGGSLYVHPHLSTVTYLTDLGAPTMVLNCRVHPMTGDWLVPGIHQQQVDGNKVEAFVCWPKQGKHLSFDGRFLHAAPPDLMEAGLFERQCALPTRSFGHDAESTDESLRIRKTLERRHRRVTFLVNVWLNYRPFNVNPFPGAMMDKLTRTPASEASNGRSGHSSLFGASGCDLQENSKAVYIDSDGVARYIANETAKNGGKDDSEATLPFTWPLGACDSGETIEAPIPLRFARHEALSGGNITLQWETSDDSHAAVLLSKRMTKQPTKTDDGVKHDRAAEGPKAKVEGNDSSSKRRRHANGT